MKLVLKYNQTIKLYTEQLKYQPIISFISTKMGLAQQSIEITYTDQDGDNIYLGDDSDLEVLMKLTADKSYVKINVKGNLKSEAEKESQMIDTSEIKAQSSLILSPFKPNSAEKINLDDSQLQQPSSKQVKNQKKSKKKAQQPKKKEKKEKVKQSPKKERKQVKKEEKKQETEINDPKEFKLFSKLMTQTINGIVGQSLHNLVPSTRNKNECQKMKQRDQVLIHQGFECKTCGVAPIVGIRYECPRCINFSICQKCEQTQFHQHNMLKIRIHEEQDKLGAKGIKNNLKKLYSLIKPEKAKLQKEVNPKQQQAINKICKELKQIFGGKVQNFRQFVQKHQDLQFNLLIQKYCEENNRQIEEARENYIDMVCVRLAKLNKIQPDSLKAFVKENFKLGYDGLAKLCKQQTALKQQPIQNKQNHSQSQEKKEQVQSHKEPQLNKIQPVPPKKKVQEKVEVQKQKPADPKPKVQQQKKQEKVQADKKKPQQIKKEKQQIICRNAMTQQKRQIYKVMVQIFGEERARQYPQFIEEHYKQGKDNIIIEWSNTSEMEYVRQ